MYLQEHNSKHNILAPKNIALNESNINPGLES